MGVVGFAPPFASSTNFSARSFCYRNVTSIHALKMRLHVNSYSLRLLNFLLLIVKGPLLDNVLSVVLSVDTQSVAVDSFVVAEELVQLCLDSRKFLWR